MENRLFAIEWESLEEIRNDIFKEIKDPKRKIKPKQQKKK